MPICALLAAAMLAAGAGVAAESGAGTLTGGVVYSLPPWFKSSFLDFPSEVEEARAQGRHVMVFMHLDECPYCARMLAESFTGGQTRDFIQTHFDVIAVNVRGDLEVAWLDGVTYTERDLAEHLGAFATPTLVFLDQDGNEVLQLSGYRDPAALRHALGYVQGKHYLGGTFVDYLAARNRPVVYSLRSHPLFAKATYFKGYAGPLAILFEDRYCGECARFHDTTLNREDVLEAMQGFLVVRLDTGSPARVVTPDGTLTTPAQWAERMGLTYRPAVALFNEGKEMYLADGRLYHHHLTEALRYVGGGYRRYGTLDEFKSAYRATLMEKGIDVDFAE